MSIYIYKNNQQLGPFEENQIFEMLRNNQLSPNDSAFRQGGKEWRKLSEIFPNAEMPNTENRAFINAAAAATARRRKAKKAYCSAAAVFC